MKMMMMILIWRMTIIKEINSKYDRSKWKMKKMMKNSQRNSILERKCIIIDQGNLGNPEGIRW